MSVAGSDLSGARTRVVASRLVPASCIDHHSRTRIGDAAAPFCGGKTLEGLRRASDGVFNTCHIGRFLTPANRAAPDGLLSRAESCEVPGRTKGARLSCMNRFSLPEALPTLAA